MTKPVPCPTCKRNLRPDQIDGCSHVECPLRRHEMSLPSDQFHDGYEPMLDGYVSKPRLEE